MLKRTVLISLLLPCMLPLAAAAGDKTAYLHFMNGMIQERKGNYDSALQEYRNTLALAPDEVYVYKQALNLALHVGKLQDADKWAEYAVSADSSSADTWVLYGNVKWAKGDADAARAAYEKAAGLDANNNEALYQLASLSSAKNPDKAVEYLQKYLLIKPEDAADIYYQIAVLYNMKGDSAQTEKYLKLAKDDDSFYVQPRYMLAELYENKPDTAAALGQYLELLALETRNTELMDHIGELYGSPAVSNLAEAEKYFLMARAVDKTDPGACFWLSAINEDRKDFAAAADIMEASRALKTDAGSVLRLGYYYTQSGRYRKAVDMLEDAYKKWPDNNEVAYFLALGYDDTGRTAKGLDLLRALVKKAPKYTEARMQYGVISERENNMPEAEAQFRALLEEKPDNATVLNYLGYALADRGLKLEEANALITKALALEPGNGAYADSMAWVLFKQGRTAEARAQIEKALALIGDDAVVWQHAGAILEASGDLKKAWLAYKTSWLLEKADKRGPAAARLKAIQKKLPAAEAAGLQAAHLKKFSPAGLEVSSFAKIQAKLRGKTVKLDAMVHFSPPDSLTLTVMGPLMAPMWTARLSGANVEMDSMALEGVDPVVFAHWAGLMMEDLRGWFSGKYLQGQAKDWDTDCVKTPEAEICSEDGTGWPVRIRPANEPRLELRPGDYFLKNLYLFARTFEFRMPMVSVRLTLDPAQMNFAPVNDLALPGLSGGQAQR